MAKPGSSGEASATISHANAISGVWIDSAARGRPLHPTSELAGWLHDRRGAGDAVAQHGLRHAELARVPRRRSWKVAWQAGGSAEFAGLDRWRTAQALERGRGILRRAGLEPRGFVAPGYAYTRHLKRELRTGYEWWTDLVGLHGPGGSRYSPALCLGASTAIKRATSPPLIRGLARVPRPLLRVDIHPADLEHRRSREAIARVLDRADRHVAVTYDELVDR